MSLRDTLPGFFEERDDFLAVGVTPRLGSADADPGWDVVLRIDGSYTDRRDAAAAAESFAEMLRGLGVPLGWRPEDVRVVDGVVKPIS